MTNDLRSEKWSGKKLIVVRFLFSYFLLFVLYDILGRLGSVLKGSKQFINGLLHFIGTEVFQISDKTILIVNNFSDTSFNYFVIGSLIGISTLAALFWTFLSKNRIREPYLFYGLHVLVRFYLGFILINYGLVKLFHLQFSEPSLMTLVTSNGQMSPIKLAWSFFGYSKGYSIFMGGLEVMGLLLFFRRTATFGALLALVVTVNIVAVNYFFDIPLKILTTNLLLMTLFLLSKDAKSFVLLLFCGEKVTLPKLPTPKFLSNPIQKIRILWGKLAFIILIGIVAGYKLYNRNAIINGEFKNSKFYGVYEVSSFETKSNLALVKTVDSTPWRYLIMEQPGYVKIIDDNQLVSVYAASIDSLDNVIELSNPYINPDPLRLNYKEIGTGQMVFESLLKEDSIRVECKVLRPSDFPLFKQRFRFINDDPSHR